MPATTPQTRPTRKTTASPAERLSLDDVMPMLEQAGSAQTRKTYARHGAREPMFGVSFATLGVLRKKIRVDHDLALALWATGNFDARNLAMKIVDPARLQPAELDLWALDMTARMCAGYVSMIAAEGPHAYSTVDRWLAAREEAHRDAGWALVGQLALRDEAKPDAWFAQHLAAIERGIHLAPNWERYAMNGAVIAIGTRNAALRDAALATAARIGHLDIDHGDTSCKTPNAVASIEKAWAHAVAKGFASPAAQERSRESPRIRC